MAGDTGSEGMEHDIKKRMDRPNAESESEFSGWGSGLGESGKNFIEIGKRLALRETMLRLPVP